MNDGRMDLVRLTIRSEQDAAVLRDHDSARVLCSATCIIVEFLDGILGAGRAAFQALLEERCISEVSQEWFLEEATYLPTKLVAQVGDFEAACRKHKGVAEEDMKISQGGVQGAGMGARNSTEGGGAVGEAEVQGDENRVHHVQASVTDFEGGSEDIF